MLFLHLLNSYCALRRIKNIHARKEAQTDEQKVNDKNPETVTEIKENNNRTNNEKELEKTQNGKDVAPKPSNPNGNKNPALQPPTDKKDEKKENPSVEKTAATAEKKEPAPEPSKETTTFQLTKFVTLNYALFVLNLSLNLYN